VCLGASGLLAGLILLASGFLLFWKLGTPSFHNEDEARNAQSAREMLETGDYLTIHDRGEPFFHKPPMKTWLIAAGYRLFGTNEFGARFGSALFAWGTVALTMLLGRALYRTGVGLLAGAILAFSTQFVHEHCGRTAELEPETVFFYVLSALCLWKIREDRRWLYALSASLGILTLVKGPVVFPILGVTALYLIYTRDRRTVAPRAAIVSGAIFLSIALPWHIHQWAVHGDAFTRMYFGAHILGRFLGSPPEDLAGTVAGLSPGARMVFYPRVLFYSLFPWSLLVIPALGRLVFHLWRGPSRAQLLLGLWVILYGATITISRGKLPAYAVPLLPALAVTVSEFSWRVYRARRAAPIVALLALGVAASIVFLHAPDYDPYARVSVRWPVHDPSVVSIRQVGEVTAPVLAAPIVTLTMALAAAALWAGRRRGMRPGTDPRAILWMATLGVFIFSGAYGTALGFRGVDRRSEIAQCADYVRGAAIEVDRVVLVGSNVRHLASERLGYWYVYDLAGGTGGEVTGVRWDGSVPADPALLEPGTLILADAGLEREILCLDGIVRLWRGQEISMLHIARR